MESLIDILLVLIPGLPLAATLVTGVLGKHVLGRWSHVPVVAAIAGSFLAAVVLLVAVRQEADQAHSGGSVGYERVVTLWTWAAVEDAYQQHQTIAPQSPGGREFRIEVALRADPLTAIMLGMVTFVSMVVAVYSIGYMHGDDGYWRFFAYIGLFVFSMTMLVSASNFVLLYVFWEAVGLCSYLLIGFWFEKPEAAAAGKKAFLVNRIGDFGFALALFLIWTTYGTLNFHDTTAADGSVIAGVLGQTRLTAGTSAFAGGALGTAICLLLMLGACGKSAQFPLHVWLPDAMEGPSPVSALIHAATMVTAGVYMVARCTPLFHASADAQVVVAIIGCFTALMAALVALTQTDLKRILAYSTISQLGYMFLGLGTGTLLGIVGGIFHLFTHAFFKALLFLGAGSVMHAMGGVIDIRRFGGLKRLMPITHATFLIGSLTLAGFPLLSAFFSKDEILAAVDERSAMAGAGGLYCLLYLTAGFTALLTAYYTFRAFFRTFHGPEEIPPEAGDHAHESPRTMTVPLVILAVASAVVGGYFWFTHGFAHFLEGTPSIAYLAHAAHGAEAVPGGSGGHWSVMVTSSILAVAGIGFAAMLWWPQKSWAVDRLTQLGKVLGGYRLSHGKFFFDEIYNVLIIWPLVGLAWLSYWVDRYVVDALVDLVGWIPLAVGRSLRSLQNGVTPFYATGMVLGLLVLVAAILASWGLAG